MSSLEIQSKLAVLECCIYSIHPRPVLPSGIGVDRLHLSFLFCIKKHNANRRQSWLFIPAPSEVVTGIITEEKLQGLFQWHFSCCSREDKRLKMPLTYLQSKEMLQCPVQVIFRLIQIHFLQGLEENRLCGVCLLALKPPKHQFQQGWSFLWLGCPLPGRLKSPFALPIYLLWPASLLFCPSHTRCGSGLSRGLMPSWFLLKLYRIGSGFWAAPDPGQLPQSWDGAVQDKQQPLGATWSHPTWVRQRSTRAAEQAGQSYRMWAELDGSRAFWFRAALQQFQHPGVPHFTELRQKPLSRGTECKRCLLEIQQNLYSSSQKEKY